MAVEGYEKRTLLQKYEIPIDHLSFEYVDKCNDPKELERIVKILRSGEEGSYPELLRSFEAKLETVMPGSRLLKSSQPAMTTRDNGYDFYMKTINEIKEFRKTADMFKEGMKNKPRRSMLEELPPVRSPGKITFSQREGKIDEPKKLRTEPKKLKSTVPRNYSEWEKYDADRELLQMDIEEEQERERIERKQKHKPDNKKEETTKVHIADGGGDYEYTHAEKIYMASQQKDRGNEYYRAGDHKQAIEHYNAALVLDPSPVAFNNRAMAYIMLHRYADAVNDCNKVLEVEPDNLKALMRRGVAYQNMNNYHKALEDFTKVTILQPNNQRAHNLARQMQDKIGERKKAVRMKIEEDGPTKRGNKVFFKPWGTSVDRSVEYNEFGLPKVVCKCSGVPNWVRNCQHYPDSSSDEEYHCKPTSESMETSETEEYSSSSVTSRLRDDSDSQVENSLKQETSIILSDDFEVEKGSGDMYSKEKTEDNGSDAMSFSDGIEPLTIHEVDFDSLLPENTEPGIVPLDNSGTNWPEEPMQEAEGIEDLSLEDDSTSKITTAFNFIHAWRNLRNSSNPRELAPLLKRIDPSDLPTLAMHTMDGPMLSSMCRCLEKMFLHDTELVLNFLKNITHVSRFNIVKYFLDQSDKEAISRLFKALEKVGCPAPADLQDAFLS